MRALGADVDVTARWQCRTAGPSPEDPRLQPVDAPGAVITNLPEESQTEPNGVRLLRE